MAYDLLPDRLPNADANADPDRYEHPLPDAYADRLPDRNFNTVPIPIAMNIA